MNRTKAFAVLGFVNALLSASVAVSSAQTVVRAVETFDWHCWRVGWNKAAGVVALDTDQAPDAPKGRSLRLDIRFSGRGFEWFGIAPPMPLWLPGNAKTLTLRYKISHPGYTVAVEFLDGWRRERMGEAALTWALPTDVAGEWRTASFPIPPNWMRPIAIKGFSVHNWARQNESALVRVWVDHVEVQTDLSEADEQTGMPRSWRPNPDEQEEQKRKPPDVALIQFSLITPAKSHVFAGEPPTLVAQIRYWHSRTQKGRIDLIVRDFLGREVTRLERTVLLENLTEVVFPLPLKQFGWYQAEGTLTLEEGSRYTKRLAFAFLPPPRTLTEEQKLASPYGLNVHGGREGFDPEPFRKAGIVWFRDYAFNFETMRRARGDGRFDGWPWYHQLLWQYERLGAKVLACLQGAIPRPAKENLPAIPQEPTPDWRREIASFLLAFPQVTHWELDNEYDLAREVREWEEQTDWRNYRAYHKAFADLVRALGGNALVAVEQGQVGIHPERIRRCVLSGDFAHIAVVNVHHYCGADPPELNLVNFNPTEDTREVAGSFFDLLRLAKQAARSDGKERQLWLTEFGWDTEAGHVVSPYEQAAYLQRGWLLALAAGVDKAFWFYERDAAEPHQFFDGCGLLTADGQPKLALCALAALTYLLPQPRYIGDINAGEGTMGFVFENEGEKVAALWSLESDDGPTVQFNSGRLYDFLGNPLPERTYRLQRAPVFVCGLSPNESWLLQTAYALETPLFVPVAAGDTFTVQVKIVNNRSVPINARLRLAVPNDWQVTQQESSVQVPVGEQTAVAFRITVAPSEPEGVKQIRVEAWEGGQLIKEMFVRAIVRSPIVLTVTPLEGEPGRTKVTVRLHNRSQQTAKGTLRLSVPKSWAVEPATTVITDLVPGETRTVNAEVAWTLDWQPQESAQVVFVTEAGGAVAAFLVPSVLPLHRAPKVTIDGKLDEWGTRWAVPSWALRSTFGDGKVRLFWAWAPEGLYIAAEVRDSRIKVADPRSFWNGDCIELFVDTKGDKRHRSFEPGDHQFWLVPLCNEGRVYVGQWKRGNEIPQTHYDLPNIKGVARKTEDGYIMEVLLLAEALQNFRPQVGARLGLNINITVKGQRFDREVYWLRPKDWSTLHLPHLWGSVVLSE